MCDFRGMDASMQPMTGGWCEWPFGGVFGAAEGRESRLVCLRTLSRERNSIIGRADNFSQS
jgi:hypothetical protein